MDEFRAAMGICNLRRIDECIDTRKKVYERYVERLSGIDGIYLCKPQDDVISNYAYFPVYFEPQEFGKSRDIVFEELAQADIHARKYFYPAVNEMTCYRERYKNQLTPVAHNVAAKILTLPMYEELALEDVDRICNIILS